MDAKDFEIDAQVERWPEQVNAESAEHLIWNNFDGHLTFADAGQKVPTPAIVPVLFALRNLEEAAFEAAKPNFIILLDPQGWMCAHVEISSDIVSLGSNFTKDGKRLDNYVPFVRLRTSTFMTTVAISVEHVFGVVEKRFAIDRAHPLLRRFVAT